MPHRAILNHNLILEKSLRQINPPANWLCFFQVASHIDTDPFVLAQDKFIPIKTAFYHSRESGNPSTVRSIQITERQNWVCFFAESKHKIIHNHLYNKYLRYI